MEPGPNDQPLNPAENQPTKSGPTKSGPTRSGRDESGRDESGRAESRRAESRRAESHASESYPGESYPDRNHTDDGHNLGEPLDPAASLLLIQREQQQAERVLTPDPRIFLWPWGFAWLVGFTLYFLRYGPDGRVFVDLPSWLPLLVLLCLIAAAGVISGVYGARAGRFVTGPTSQQGAMYGIAWSIAFAGVSIVLARVSDGLPVALSNLLWTGVMVALTGALHMAGGAIFRDRAVFVLGVWTSVVNVAGVAVGPGWHALIVAVLGGGGMLVAGALSWWRLHR